jgi:threonine dehydratase
MMTPAANMHRDATDWGSDTDTPPAPISIADVKRARKVIKPFLTPTPCISNPVLNERVGAEIFVKLENIQDIGAFKIRGAINLLATMDEKERAKGIVTATRGNYGAALAQACAMYDTKCTVFVPQGNSPDKNAAVAALGGELIIKGHDFDAAWDASVRHAWNSDAISVHPGKRPELVAGQATVALEMLSQIEDGLDVIIVPVGGGSLAAGTTTVVKAVSPQTRIIAVQAENAPAFHHAWHTSDYAPMVATKTIAGQRRRNLHGNSLLCRDHSSVG